MSSAIYIGHFRIEKAKETNILLPIDFTLEKNI